MKREVIARGENVKAKPLRLSRRQMICSENFQSLNKRGLSKKLSGEDPTIRVWRVEMLILRVVSKK